MRKYANGLIIIAANIILGCLLVMPEMRSVENSFVYWLGWAMVLIMVCFGVLEIYRAKNGKAD